MEMTEGVASSSPRWLLPPGKLPTAARLGCFDRMSKRESRIVGEEGLFAGGGGQLRRKSSWKLNAAEEELEWFTALGFVCNTNESTVLEKSNSLNTRSCICLHKLFLSPHTLIHLTQFAPTSSRPNNGHPLKSDSPDN